MKTTIILAFCILTASCQPSVQKNQIRQAVQQQMQTYPLSRLQDLYKSFFQDQFGPGHLLADTASAAAYLRRELAQRDSFAGTLYEPTGYQGNFYRINLALLKEGHIAFDTFFDAFVRSTNSVKPMSAKEWIAQWKTIEKIISDLYPDIDNYQSDKATIDSLLQIGEFAVHHSAVYNQAYDPHYRIIDKAIFEQELLPKLK